MTLSHSTSLRRSTALSPEVAEGADSDAYLWETPADLLCPITHELFHEPVINAAGQVYERVAIEQALAHRLVDPISNLPLDTATLTIVWPMKSKAAAYRERALRGCVERLCRPACRSPIRYLRRAAELSAGITQTAVDASGAVLGLPGLTPDVIQYLLTHPSSIYDFQALSRYGASLAAGGYRDLAASVYTKLLHLGGDSQQQVEALQGLLACWGGAREEEEEEVYEHRLVERLAALSCGEGPDGCRPARFVGVLLEAGLREELVLRFCEHILGSCSCSVDKAGAQFGAAVAAVGPGAFGYPDLLFVYTKLRCGRLEAALTAQRKAGAGTSAGGCTDSERGLACGVAAEGTGRVSDGDCAGQCRDGEGKLRLRCIRRAICSAVFALSSLVGPNRPLARVLQVTSALLLLNPPLRPGDG
ncbi:hypothetical protein PLESTB_001171600 [Pleodorina starrii]|uniref:U-box domain-containing protein n=1 Tax=Pleodorina starrii TaxID=330485 RepID=A0A9W6BRA1_9CHLO|nr:hypothetical protein PLESTB_001171600 [Pleodorina starrii]GLC64829.1 hypothetical protein PLESTF_000211900 [Pleodorina starrii]